MQEIVPRSHLNARLKQVHARIDRELSTGPQNVYFSRPMRKYIIATARADGNVELTYQDDCPCAG